jgi:serine/threonine protein kinase
MNVCPPAESWRAYVEDLLSPGDDQAHTEHVRQCPACEAVLAKLVAPLPAPRADHAQLPSPPEALVEGLRRLGAEAFAGGDPASPDTWPRPDGFEIRGVLGRGGTGIVYRARQHDPGREVALKMIAAGERCPPGVARRLLFDAATAARVRHDHVVRVFAVGRHLGLPYVVMELVGGGSLAQRVSELVARPRQAARLVASAARALHHAHQLGVCHRDVKPGNILLRPRGPQDTAGGQPPLAELDACVIDFGLARRTRRVVRRPRSGVPVGTPGYTPPEQIRSERPSPAVDVYGLGAVLYECLTGRPPARAATPFDTLLRTLHEEPPRPAVFNPHAPRELEAVCLKCLEKEPHGRYESAAALADDLERWLRGEAVNVGTVDSRGRSWWWSSPEHGHAGLPAPKRPRIGRRGRRAPAGEG